VPFDLLETIRWTPGEGWYLLDRHLARLGDSARHFRFVYPQTEIREGLDRAVRSARGPLRVRLLLASDGTVRIEHTPLGDRAGVWRVRFAEHPVDPSDEFLYHKTTNRAVYERASRPDCDDVILWNAAGEITETTIANLVVEPAGEVEAGVRRVTPPVACGLLPGTLRAELLAAGEITEARVTVEQLKRASRFWLVNSVRGWVAGALIE
jgi:branched-subunit amino acid aminotransferase/4-amino-4-deoxychorismate lyase